MTCPNCGSTVHTIKYREGDQKWGCANCTTAAWSGNSAILGMVYCEGNPGHDPITIAYAREMNSRRVHRLPNGDTEVYHDTGRKFFFGPGFGAA